MRARFTAATVAALIVGVSLSVTAAEQRRTVFNTPDFRQDRALWTDANYFLNNTPGQMRGMALDIDSYGSTGQPSAARRYASVGTGRVGALNLASPYPFQTAAEHYEAWLREANGGTKHTKETIPDWSGWWESGGGFGGGPAPASETVKYLKPAYQESYVQELKAVSEGRIWTQNSFCLPPGFFTAVQAREFVVTPERVWAIGEGNGYNTIRWIYTDGTGHTEERLRFPKWHGESIGFWNGDSLIVYTNQIRGWKGGVSEFSDKLETIERYRRVGDRIEAEMTAYDPDVFVGPIHTKMTWTLDNEVKPERRPLYNTCTDTNGPSTKVYMDENGLLNERLSGEGDYQWDVSDSRPWVTWFTESDRRYKAYLAAGGKPHGAP